MRMYIVTEENSCKGLDLVKDVWKVYSNIIKGFVSKCDTQTLELLLGKVCIIDYSHHLCPMPPCHIVACVSYVTWKQWFGHLKLKTI